MRKFREMRHLSSASLGLLVAAFLLTSCFRPSAEKTESASPGIRVLPVSGLDEKIQDTRFFFLEYLSEADRAIRRVAIFIESPKDSLAFTLDSKRYRSGVSGISTLKEIISRFTPLRPSAIYDLRGKILGYALLNEKDTLRLVSEKEGRHILGLVQAGP